MTTDIDKWIRGETDVFFNPDKAQRGLPSWKRIHSVIAIGVSLGCALAVIGFESLFSTQVSTPVARTSAEPVIRPDLTEQTTDFMQSYWQSVEEPGDRVLPYLNSVYAPMVIYYGNQLPKEAVLRDKYYFLKRWPIRQTWETDNPTISCNEPAAECKITGARKYMAMNRSNHASGVVRYAYAIRFSGGSPKIIGEDSKTVHQ